MTAEVISQNITLQMNRDKRSIFDYPPCGGREGSSSTNWVPTDYLSYKIARLLHITDEDLKKKEDKSSIITPK